MTPLICCLISAFGISFSHIDGSPSEETTTASGGLIRIFQFGGVAGFFPGVKSTDEGLDLPESVLS